MLSLEADPKDWSRLCLMYNLFWTSSLCRMVLGCCATMVQVFNGGYSNTDRTTAQRLRRFHQVYLSKLVELTIPAIENLNKVVEVRLSPQHIASDPKAKRPYKLTYLLKEIMGMTIMKEEEEL